MVTSIFVVIISILVIEFGLSRYLSFLNIQNSKLSLPEILLDIYDKEKYDKQQDYFRTNTSYGMVTGGVSFLLTMIMFLFGGFAFVDELVRSWTNLPILQSLLFFTVIFIANDLIMIPFQYYHTFVVEEKFGFNKMTLKTFILDNIKSILLSFIVGGAILALVIWIYTLTPDYFWLLAWLLTTGFSLVMGMFYSELIVPLFNKQTPLPEGELRTAIEKFASKADFKLKNIYIIDGSKRSTKANAYFSGLGPKKRIVLYDTLSDTLSVDEIVAVLAHEIGHYKHKHVLKNFFISFPFSLILFYLLGLMLNSNQLAMALGGTQASFHLNAIAFFVLYTPISMGFDLITNLFSRKYEYQADAFADNYGFGQQLISGLKKLSSSSLSNLMPHPLYVFFNYSHPTLYQRISKIKKM